MENCSHDETPTTVRWNPATGQVECHKCGQVFHARTVAEAAALDLLDALQAIAKQCPPSLSRGMYSTLSLHDDERDAMYAAIKKATS